MSDTDPIEWQLLDTDLQTVLAILPANSPKLYVELNEPGSGEISIPKNSAAAALITSGQFVRARYRGAYRGGFFVENVKDTDASGGEAGDEWRVISGRGALALLDDAIVWDDGTIASTREFSEASMASVLIDLIDEAQARGGLAILTYDFSATLDSDGASWTDSQPVELTVGKSVLSVLRDFAKKGLEFDISLETDGTFTLHAYVRKGIDKSETVYFRIGANCKEVSGEELGGGIKNVLRVKYKSGFTTVQDATSIAARRRRESLVQEESAGSSEAAITFGQSRLAFSKDPQNSINIELYDGVSPFAFVGYDTGDTVTLDKKGVEAEYRVRGMQLSWAEDYADVVLSLNSTIIENEIRMALEIENLRELWTRMTDTGLPIIQFWAAITAPATGSNIQAIAIGTDKIYVGGTFSKIGGVLANNIAEFDLVTGAWSALGSGLNAACYAIVVDGSNVYAGGSFTLAGGVSASYVAKWNGTAWSAMGSGVNSACWTLALDGTDVLAGGDITSGPNWSLMRWNGSTWAVEGATVAGKINVVKVDGNGDIFIGGEFLSSGATTLNYIAKKNGAAWDPLGSGLDNYVRDLDFVDTDVYAGGDFTDHIAIWNGSSWSVLGDGVNGSVSAVTASLTDVYIGGSFTQAGDIAASRIAKWNGGSWVALGPGLSSSGQAIAILDYLTVVVGGSFQLAGGKSSPFAALYITTLEEVLNYLDGAGDGVKHNELPDLQGGAPDEYYHLAEELYGWLLLALQQEPSGLPGQYLGGDGNYYDLPTTLSFFLEDTASDITGYKSLTASVPSGSEANAGATITGADTLIEEFAALANQFGFIAAQVLHVHIHLANTTLGMGSKDAVCYVEVYHRTSGGSETLLGTSDDTAELTNMSDPYDLDVSVADTAFSATDRLVIKIYSSPSGVGTDPDVAVYYQGTTYSRIGIGSSPTGGGGGGTPGGSNTQVQFNDGGIFGGSGLFKFDKSTGNVIIGDLDFADLPGGAENTVFVALDGAAASHFLWAWGDNSPRMVGLYGEGSKASPSAPSDGADIFRIQARAYDGTDWNDTVGEIQLVAIENHDGSNKGTKWEVYAVPAGSATRELVATFDEDGIDLASGKTFNINGSPHGHDYIPNDGWISISDTWTRTGDNTFTVSGDVTGDPEYQPGIKIKVTDTGGTVYGVIDNTSYSSPNTTVTLIDNDDHNLSSGSLTSPYVSYIENPAGFPNTFNFTPAWTGLSVGNGTIDAYLSVSSGIVKGRISLVFGNTTSISAFVRVAYPTTRRAFITQRLPLGVTIFWDDSAGSSLNSTFLGNTTHNETSDAMVPQVTVEDGTNVHLQTMNVSVPFTWTTDDEVDIFFEYPLS